MTVRTRVAPSPTGDPHVGTAYIALFNQCFAHAQNGQFILRIEDTDQLRSSAHSEQEIFKALKWLGLHWDEGPDVGGDFGPYRQSERKQIYLDHVQKLVDQGDAFPCFCSAERLDTLRKKQQENKEKPGYDGHCLHLSDQEREQKIQANEAHVIRMKVPREGQCEFNDMLRGKISIDWSQVDMQILLKADGMPTYHLANVVDDHLMEISHVLRGEEWINSAPKHQLLYKYFGWEMPELCHMPLLRNPDKSKLSKRKNPTSINYYRRAGFVPEAVLNYLARMGWSMPDESEQFSYQQMLDNFDIQRINLGGPVFDLEKLTWLNGVWLRESFDDAQLFERFKSWLSESVAFEKLIPAVKERVDTFGQVAELSNYFLADTLRLDVHLFEKNKLELTEQVKVLQFVLWELDTVDEWTHSAIEEKVFNLPEKMGLKIRDFVAPLFIALSGKPSAISVILSIEVLGKDIARARLRSAIETLGGVSKKAGKKLEKEYAALSKQ